MSPDTGPLGGPYSISTAEFPARAPQRLKVSFEFSPPKTEAAERTLWETVTRLTPLQPTFYSVTYGAGGSTRQRTHETVARLKKETGVDAAAHLTCVGATQGEIDEIARAYWDAGIRHIVALRGDPPGGMGGKYSPHPGGYANAAELIAGLKKIGPFQISAACYPEKHPDSADARADLENLKRKVDAGPPHGAEGRRRRCGVRAGPRSWGGGRVRGQPGGRGGGVGRSRRCARRDVLDLRSNAAGIEPVTQPRNGTEVRPVKEKETQDHRTS